MLVSVVLKVSVVGAFALGCLLAVQLQLASGQEAPDANRLKLLALANDWFARNVPSADPGANLDFALQRSPRNLIDWDRVRLKPLLRHLQRLADDGKHGACSLETLEGLKYFQGLNIKSREHAGRSNRRQTRLELLVGHYARQLNVGQCVAAIEREVLQRVDKFEELLEVFRADLKRSFNLQARDELPAFELADFAAGHDPPGLNLDLSRLIAHSLVRLGQSSPDVRCRFETLQVDGATGAARPVKFYPASVRYLWESHVAKPCGQFVAQTGDTFDSLFALRFMLAERSFVHDHVVPLAGRFKEAAYLFRRCEALFEGPAPAAQRRLDALVATTVDLYESSRDVAKLPTSYV